MSQFDDLKSAIDFASAKSDAVQHSVDQLLEVTDLFKDWRRSAMRDSTAVNSQSLQALRAAPVSIDVALVPSRSKQVLQAFGNWRNALDTVRTTFESMTPQDQSHAQKLFPELKTDATLLG